MKKERTKASAKKKNYCYICNKTIAGNSYKFNCHLYTHNKTNARFECQYCLKTFFRNDAYIRHLSVHEGKGKNKGKVRKTYICDVCDKTFLYKCNMIKHFTKHDSTYRPRRFEFFCSVCGIKYCENRLLLRHIRRTHFNLHVKESLHEKKMPNDTWVEKVKQTDVYVEMTKLTDNVIAIKKCEQIKNEIEETKTDGKLQTDDKLFIYDDRRHYSKAVCNYCNKEMLKKSLLNHIREKHLKMRKFKCDTCNENFSRRYQWSNHICGSFKSKPRRY